MRAFDRADPSSQVAPAIVDPSTSHASLKRIGRKQQMMMQLQQLEPFLLDQLQPVWQHEQNCRIRLEEVAEERRSSWQIKSDEDEERTIGKRSHEDPAYAVSPAFGPTVDDAET